jgi:hypothetical protein
LLRPSFLVVALRSWFLNRLLRRTPPVTAFLRYLVAWLGWRRTTRGFRHGTPPLTCSSVISLGGWRLLALLWAPILLRLLPLLALATALLVFRRAWGRGLLPLWQWLRLQLLLAAAVFIFYCA